MFVRWGGMQNAWERSTYKISVGKPERKRPLGGPKRRCEDKGSSGNRVKSCGLDDSATLPEHSGT
jgi:hypothetical protein